MRGGGNSYNDIRNSGSKSTSSTYVPSCLFPFCKIYRSFRFAAASAHGSLDGRILIGNSTALLHCIRILITESKSSTAACIRLDYQWMCRSSKFGVRSGFVLISCLAGPKCATTTVQAYSVRAIAP